MFFDTVFAFGLQPATLGCPHTTNAITYLYLLDGYFCTNYIDDFRGCNTPSRAADVFHALKRLLSLLGLQTSPEKDCPPTTLMALLGILIETVAMTLSIPKEKVNELLRKLPVMYLASMISCRHLQSVLALMSFVKACVRPGRIFMSGLLNGLHGLPHNGFLPISSEIRFDIQWWLTFLPWYNGVSVILHSIYSPEVLIRDACITGAFEGYFGHQCFQLAFPDSIMTNDDYNINVKEFLAIIIALRLWGSDLKGNRVLIQSDNLNAVQAVSHQRSHSPLSQQCLHVVWFLCATFDLDLPAKHSRIFQPNC